MGKPSRCNLQRSDDPNNPGQLFLNANARAAQDQTVTIAYD